MRVRVRVRHCSRPVESFSSRRCRSSCRLVRHFCIWGGLPLQTHKCQFVNAWRMSSARQLNQPVVLMQCACMLRTCEVRNRSCWLSNLITISYHTHSSRGPMNSLTAFSKRSNRVVLSFTAAKKVNDGSTTFGSMLFKTKITNAHFRLVNFQHHYFV